MEDYPDGDVYHHHTPGVAMTPDAIMHSWTHEPEGSHVCLCSGAPPWRAKQLPFGVCHIQDMETSPRAVDHIMDPWTHLVSELLGMMSLGHSSYWLASIPYYACARRSLASIGYPPSVWLYALVRMCILRDTVHAAGHDHDHHPYGLIHRGVRLCELMELWVSGWTDLVFILGYSTSMMCSVVLAAS